MSDLHGSGAEGHAVVTLSFTFDPGDGGRVFQSWDLCECSASPVRTRLLTQIGPPDHETRASAAEVAATAQAVLRVPVDQGGQ
jgi:hypothetical protein